MHTDIRGIRCVAGQTIAENYGRIEGSSRGKENGPKTAETVSGPNPNTLMEVGLMPTIVSPAADNPADELRKHAIGYLKLTRAQGESFHRNRAYYAEMGRRYGLTNREMGDILGVTEGRVRQIIAGGDE